MIDCLISPSNVHKLPKPETAIPPDVSQDGSTSYSTPVAGQAALVNSAAGAASALAGWALSSLNRSVSETDDTFSFRL